MSLLEFREQNKGYYGNRQLRDVAADVWENEGQNQGYKSADEMIDGLGWRKEIESEGKQPEPAQPKAAPAKEPRPGRLAGRQTDIPATSRRLGGPQSPDPKRMLASPLPEGGVAERMQRRLASRPAGEMQRSIGSTFRDTAGVVLEGLKDLPAGVLETAKSAWRGGDFDFKYQKDVADYIADLEKRQAEQNAVGERYPHAARGVQGAMESIPYSLATLGATLGAGAAGSLAGGIGGVAAGGAASAATSYRASRDEFMQEGLLRLRDELGRVPTPREVDEMESRLDAAATEYGGHEAAWETLGNLFFAKALGPIARYGAGKLGGVLGGAGSLAGRAAQSTAGKLAVGSAAAQLEEQTTEALTYLGQEGVRKRLGWREADPTLKEYFQEGAPATFWQTLLLGATAQGVDHFSQRLKANPDELTLAVGDAVRSGVLEQLPDSALEGDLKLAARLERKGRKNADLSAAREVIEQELARRTKSGIRVSEEDFRDYAAQAGQVKQVDLSTEKQAPPSPREPRPPVRMTAGELQARADGRIADLTARRKELSRDERRELKALRQADSKQLAFAFNAEIAEPEQKASPEAKPAADTAAIEQIGQLLERKKKALSRATSEERKQRIQKDIERLTGNLKAANGEAGPVSPEEAATREAESVRDVRVSELQIDIARRKARLLAAENKAERQRIQAQIDERQKEIYQLKPEQQLDDQRDAARTRATRNLANRSNLKTLRETAQSLGIEPRQGKRAKSKSQLAREIAASFDDEALGLGHGEESRQGSLLQDEGDLSGRSTKELQEIADGLGIYTRIGKRMKTPAELAVEIASKRAELEQMAAEVAPAPEPVVQTGEQEAGDAREISSGKGGLEAGEREAAFPGAAGQGGGDARGPVEAAATKGRATRIAVPGKGKVDAEFEVVELGDIAPSHIATRGFQKNPRYGLENERAYEAETESRNKVLENAARLDAHFLIDSPDANHGAPVVDAQGNVLGGNGRAMSIEYALEKFPEKYRQYRADLEARAAEAGIDPQVIRGMEKPVLIRRVTGEMDAATRQAFVPDLNESFTAARQKTMTAKSRGDRISGGTIRRIGAGLMDHDSLRQLFDSEGSRPVVDALVRDGALQKSELNGFIGPDGLLNPDGKTAIEQALRGRLALDYDTLRRLPALIVGKIDGVIPYVLVSEQVEGYGLMAELSAAVSLLGEYGKATGKDFGIFLDNLPLEGGKTARDRYSQKAQAVALAALEMNKTAFRAAWAQYANYARQSVGALPGFAKNPKEAAQAAFGDYAGLRFRRSAPRPAGFQGMGREAVAAVLDPILAGKRWPQSLAVELVQDEAELPPPLAARIEERGYAGTIQGAYHDGKVWLVAGNLANRAEVEQTLAHEALGHHGLRVLLGAGYQDMMDTAWENAKVQVRARQQLGGDWRKSSRVERSAAVDEALVRMMDAGERAGILDRIIAAVRRALRRMGFKTRFSDAEVRDLISRGRRVAETGVPRTGSEGDIRFRRSNQQPEVPAGLRARGREFLDLLGSVDLSDSDAWAELEEMVDDATPDWTDEARAGMLAGMTAKARRPELRARLEQLARMYDPAAGVQAPEEQSQARNPLGYLRRLTADIANHPTSDGDTLRDYLIRRFQDRYIRLKRVQDHFRTELFDGSGLPEELDAYLAEELYHGKVGHDVEQFHQKRVKPLVAAMRESGIEPGELSRYLYARHAPERNAKKAEQNPRFRGAPGSGMSDGEAAEILDRFAAEGKAGRLEALAKMVWDLNRNRLDRLLAAGMIAQQDHDNMVHAYQYYVPLRGSPEAAGFPDIGRGFDIRNRGVRYSAGRASRAENPLLHSLAQYEATLIKIRRNEVGKKFLAFVLQNRDARLWEVNRAGKRPRFNRDKGEYEEAALPAAADLVQTLAVVRDGRHYYIKIKDRLLADAMTGIGTERAGAVTRTLARFNRFIAAMATSFNPEFVLSNALRDIQTAGINLTAEHSAGLARKVAMDAPAALKAAYRGFGGHEGGAAWDRWYREYRQEGGAIGFFGLNDVEAMGRGIDALLRESGPGASAAVRRGWNRTLGYIERLNRSIENAARLSAYKNAREAGMSRAAAASLARNLTVNFNRKGELGSLLNAWYLFYNAGMQGSARFLRMIRTRRGQRIGAGIVAGSMMLTMLNRLAAGQDDDGENFYDKIPDYERERYLILMNPFGGRGDYFKIVLPYGYNVFHLLGEQLASNAGRDSLGAARNIVTAVLNSFNPLGGSDDLESIAAPTVMDPVIDLATNRNFAGYSIMPERNPFERYQRPQSERYFESVNPALKSLAKTLNRATGGGETRSGLVDVSPEVMEYLVGFLTGGLGNFVDRGMGGIARVAQGELPAAHAVPGLRRFYGTQSEYQTRQRFHAAREDIYAALELKKRGKVEPGSRDARLLGLSATMKSAEAAVRRLDETLEKLERQDETEEVKEKRKKVEEKQEEVMKGFLRIYSN